MVGKDISMEVGCLEVVVNRRSNTLMRVLFIAAIFLAVCFVILAFMFHILLLIPAAGCAAAAYYAWLESDVDYEYAYVDRELRIAKIMRKQKRKEIGVYDLTKMEIMAPVSSHQLDGYRGRNLNVLDFSTGKDQPQENRYAVILDDNTELILDLDGEYGRQIITQIRTYYPRKTYMN